MDLTVSSKNIIGLDAISVQLAPTLGAFELVVIFKATIHGMTDNLYRWVNLYSARLSLRDKGGSVYEVGLLEPDAPVVLRQRDNAQPRNFSFKLALQPHQVGELEKARDGGDINFVLRFQASSCTSESTENQDEHYSDVQLPVPQSAWITQYNASKAGAVLLFEVRLPSGALRHPAEHHLFEAQRKLDSGDWRGSVSECRQFAEELGGTKMNAAFDKLANARKTMTKDERADAVIAAIQNYGHAATHSESRNGELEYSRADAKLMISLAASLAEFHFNQK
jgi:hypothetical protein